MSSDDFQQRDVGELHLKALQWHTIDRAERPGIPIMYPKL